MTWIVHCIHIPESQKKIKHNYGVECSEKHASYYSYNQICCKDMMKYALCNKVSVFIKYLTRVEGRQSWIGRKSKQVTYGKMDPIISHIGGTKYPLSHTSTNLTVKKIAVYYSKTIYWTSTNGAARHVANNEWRLRTNRDVVESIQNKITRNNRPSAFTTICSIECQWLLKFDSKSTITVFE